MPEHRKKYYFQVRGGTSGLTAAICRHLPAGNSFEVNFVTLRVSCMAFRKKCCRSIVTAASRVVTQNCRRGRQPTRRLSATSPMRASRRQMPSPAKRLLEHAECGNLRKRIATWRFLRRNIGRQCKIGVSAANSSERLQSHKLLFHPVCRSPTFNASPRRTTAAELLPPGNTVRSREMIPKYQPCQVTIISFERE
jgi:hypothetical protein